MSQNLRSGVEEGPRDASEGGAPRFDRVDLGGPRVPVFDSFKIQPMPDGDVIFAVTVVQEPTTVQLQAFSSQRAGSLEGTGESMLNRTCTMGESAGKWVGPIEAEIPGTYPAGRPDGQSLKVFACGGSSWTLRGIATGLGDEPDSVDEWAYETLLGTVVVPDLWGGRDTTMASQWPQAAR
ncbi:DUF3710 domain-containing protein [Streptomyces xanthochromogenes]|uniref:DUF3710 domain-containing protein n=1 Tax=Streptomyces xanthochromogenes TaxID=67384 RepID=UPI0034205EF6